MHNYTAKKPVEIINFQPAPEMSYNHQKSGTQVAINFNSCFTKGPKAGN